MLYAIHPILLSALLQTDAAGRERVIAFESRQLKAAEKNNPVHDKELRAMKYTLVNFRVHLRGSKPSIVYSDHAPLRTATQSPHLSQRMARWINLFAEYNFEVKYKPGNKMCWQMPSLADLIMGLLMSRLRLPLLRSSFMWNIHGILSVWRCFMPLGVRHTGLG